MIQKIFRVVDRSYKIVQYKQKSWILDTAADKTFDADKR